MRTFILILLLSSPCFAAQKYGFKDPRLDDEFVNNYKEHSYPNIVNGKSRIFSANTLTVSSNIVVGSSVTNSVDPGISINRTLNSSSGAGVGHGFADSTYYGRTSGLLAYSSFDAEVNVTNALNNDHYGGFQSHPFISLSNNAKTTSVNGLITFGRISAGTIEQVRGVDVEDFEVFGGSVAVQYGLLVNHLAAGATNYGVYVADNSSFFGGGLVGVTAGSNACTGCIEEYISSTTVLVNFPATTQFGDLVAITLTAGDWDVSAFVDTRGSTPTNIQAGISTTAGNSSTGLVYGSNLMGLLSASTTSDNSGSLPNYRVNITVNTTYYLKVEATYGIGTPTIAGTLSARRRR